MFTWKSSYSYQQEYSNGKTTRNHKTQIHYKTTGIHIHMIKVIHKSYSLDTYTNFSSHITTCAPIGQPQYQRGYKSLSQT